MSDKERMELLNLRKRVQAQREEINRLQRRGTWIDHQQGRWIYARCSECDKVHDVKTNYCPNCGARMEVDE